MTAIQADYRTHKHIPSRKCYQLIMEVAEENFPEICRVLGYPQTGENTFVGIARIKNPPAEIAGGNIGIPISEKSEGEKLRTRAVMLCKEEMFYEFIKSRARLQNSYIPPKGERQTNEQWCITSVYNHCSISSRSELATDELAQRLFYELDCKYKDWLFEQQHIDNLGRG